MPFCLGEKRIHSAFTVASKFAGFTSSSAEEIHSVGTINNVKTFLLYTTEVCYLMTTFRCLSDILITSWLFTARWSTWPGNHLVPCVAELVGACIPIRINAHRCLPDPKCLFYPSGLSLCLSVDHFCLVPVDDMVLFHGMVCDGWLVSYTAFLCPGGSGLCTSCERVHFFLVFFDPQTELPACLFNVWAGAVLARHTIDHFGLLFILDIVLRMDHKVP